MPKSFVKLIATFFYVGYFPLIPGTAGSLAGLLVYFLVKDNILAYILTLAILMILGFLAGGKAAGLMQRKDPPCVVIDEVCGMLLGLLFLPYSFKLVIIGFFVFRLLDTLKPYPAGRLEKLKGGPGIMMDDIAAGIYTNLILQAGVMLTFFKAS
ncbi:MAG: phosphatidylglycerophosphatase A [Candidatus Omnitrophota bacterium]